MIKLVAIDLDGTLLNSKKEISLRNKETLKKAKAAGIKVVICTGRPLKAIHHILEELNLEEAGDYSVTFNGGLVQKNDTAEIMEKKALTLDEVKRIYEVVQPLALPLDVISDGIVLQLPSVNESLYAKANPVLTFEKAELSDLTEDMIFNKCISAAEAEFLDNQSLKFPKELYDEFEIIKSRDILLEFMPKGVTKAYGIELLAKDLGIKQSEIMAIGDEENDLPMIEYAKIGVAMKNAVPMIKVAATVETDTNENDGVAKAIEKYILEPLGMN
ncbi:MAG: Cof-type HAD-IIB family hydrolase [Lactobacillales bacterium]|jgi:Cof subfamily protein (haloacid dehalogenase superfamily)|nr:Cof-type HAD-IIB family hydrolase [Lactobacillales bacterium]